LIIWGVPIGRRAAQDELPLDEGRNILKSETIRPTAFLNRGRCVWPAGIRRARWRG
jgi:hypothetical protein